MSRAWAILTIDGKLVTPTVYAADEAAVRAHHGGSGHFVVPLERPLVDFETVTLDGQIIHDEEARAAHARGAIDRGYRDALGDAAIVAAHVRKAIEAETVLAGGHGRLLSAEAKARRMPVKDLARLVLERDDATIAAEVARVTAKSALG